MSWYGLEGHDQQVERFRRQLRHGRMPGSYLFVGPPGIGKSRFAAQLATCLLCTRTPQDQLEACRQCPSCQQVAAESHPDLEIVRKPDDRSSLPIELLIGDREHRMQTGFCRHVAMRPTQGPWRIGILHDADSMQAEAANSLLKTLEEPPGRSVIILIAHSELRQLPTIRSRCQIIRFQSLDPAVSASLLERLGTGGNSQQRRDLARLAHGSLAWACELAEPEVQETAGQIWQRLARIPTDWPDVIRTVQETVSAAGKEPAPRRRRLRQVVWLAAEFYRQLMRHLATGSEPEIEQLEPFIRPASRHWPGDPQTAAECLLQCHDALNTIELNAYPPALIDAWLDQLRRIVAHA